MPDSSYPESAVDPDIREGRTQRPSLCVPGTLGSSVWRVVLMSSILENINRCSVIKEPMRMEPHEAGGFV